MDETTFAELCRALDVPPTASVAQIRAAYRLLVKVWHPDRFTEDAAVQSEAVEKLKAVNDAYARLRAVGFRPPAAPGGASRSVRPQTPVRGVAMDPPLATLEVEASAEGPLRVWWRAGVPHPNLFGDRPRIALAALVFGRALAEAPDPARGALLLAAEDAGHALETSGGTGALDELRLRATTGEGLWPRELALAGDGEAPEEGSVWRARLRGVVTPRLEATAPAGREAGEWWALPALAGIALLARGLARPEQRVLGRVLRTVGEFFASPSERFSAGCESRAVARAMPVLGAVVVPHGRA